MSEGIQTYPGDHDLFGRIRQLHGEENLLSYVYCIEIERLGQILLIILTYDLLSEFY